LSYFTLWDFTLGLVVIVGRMCRRSRLILCNVTGPESAKSSLISPSSLPPPITSLPSARLLPLLVLAGNHGAICPRRVPSSLLLPAPQLEVSLGSIGLYGYYTPLTDSNLTSSWNTPQSVREAIVNS